MRIEPADVGAPASVASAGVASAGVASAAVSVGADAPAEVSVVMSEPGAVTSEPAAVPSEPDTGSATPHRRGFIASCFRQTPLALVIAGVGAGLLVIGLHHFRWGNVGIGVALLAGALLRLVLPTRQAGLLAVRSRFTDVVTMVAIGGALLVLALVTRT